jgi:DNA (cytosine-5)-methyltransferase 1
MKPKLLDLFCGAGGCSMGYFRAGFEVVGVDIKNQPHYPFEFHQADALEYVAEHGQEFDVIHASPPCQDASWAARRWRNVGREYPKLIEPTRELLQASGLPWVMENVTGAAFVNPIALTGVMFGLKVIRRRIFESNILILAPPHEPPTGSVPNGDYVTVAGHGGESKDCSLKGWREAMGIDWMNKEELTQAIPPIYTEFIGRQLMQAIRRVA